MNQVDIPTASRPSGMLLKESFANENPWEERPGNEGENLTDFTVRNVNWTSLDDLPLDQSRFCENLSDLRRMMVNKARREKMVSLVERMLELPPSYPPIWGKIRQSTHAAG